MKKNEGFSLIELMITLAIIGILSMFAIPAYQGYVTRTIVTEALILGSAYKEPLFEYYNSNGACPNNSAGPVGSFPASSNFITGRFIRLTTGVSGVNFSIGGKTVTSQCLLTIGFDGARSNKAVPEILKNQSIRFRMALDSSGVYWQCSVGTKRDGSGNITPLIPFEFLPRECRNF